MLRCSIGRWHDRNVVQRKWLALPDSTDRLDLLSYEDGPPRFASLARVHADGSEVWVARPPEDQDAWVDVVLRGREVIATSWFGWRVSLALDNGEEVGRVFTK